MSGRLDSNGCLHDVGWDLPRLAMDAALPRIRELCRRIGRPFTVDEALQTSTDERAGADATLDKLIPGYSRLR